VDVDDLREPPALEVIEILEARVACHRDKIVQA
jgi:hypothetical protein